MRLPLPEPGLVIRYSYLWREEHLQGRDEGVKDRPCAIVVATDATAGDIFVTVFPLRTARQRNQRSRSRYRS